MTAHRHDNTPPFPTDGKIDAPDLVAALIRECDALREREARYRLLYRDAPIGIYRTSSDGRVLEANPAMARMLGLQTPEEIGSAYPALGRDLYVDPKCRAQFLELLCRHGQLENF